MLKPMKNNKKYICWLAVTGLLGIGGLLLAPFVIYDDHQYYYKKAGAGCDAGVGYDESSDESNAEK